MALLVASALGASEGFPRSSSSLLPLRGERNGLLPGVSIEDMNLRLGVVGSSGLLGRVGAGGYNAMYNSCRIWVLHYI